MFYGILHTWDWYCCNSFYSLPPRTNIYICKYDIHFMFKVMNYTLDRGRQCFLRKLTTLKLVYFNFNKACKYLPCMFQFNFLRKMFNHWFYFTWNPNTWLPTKVLQARSSSLSDIILSLQLNIKIRFIVIVYQNCLYHTSAVYLLSTLIFVPISVLDE